MTLAEYVLKSTSDPLPVFFKFLQDPATGVLFGPLVFSLIWSVWEGKVFKHSYLNTERNPQTKEAEAQRRHEMSRAEPYVAFAIHTFALVIGGLLCLIINWSHIAADTGQSEWKVIYRAVLIAASLTFIFGFFFNFFVPRDVIDRYRLALSEEREGWHRFLPRAAYGMLFSSYRWCFGIFALITSQLFNLHQSSIV